MTGEGRKLIYDFCGFKEFTSVDAKRIGGHSAFWVGCYIRQDTDGKFTYFEKLPPLDPNFYFKYAVPKLRYASLQHSDQYQGAISAYYAQVSIQFGNNYAWADDDPAEAFGQALLKMLKQDGEG